MSSRSRSRTRPGNVSGDPGMAGNVRYGATSSGRGTGAEDDAGCAGTINAAREGPGRGGRDVIREHARDDEGALSPSVSRPVSPSVSFPRNFST